MKRDTELAGPTGPLISRLLASRVSCQLVSGALQKLKGPIDFTFEF